MHIDLMIVLNRKSILQRKSAGRSSRKQLIAANIDRAFIIQGLDTTLNLNRIERYLVMVHEGNIEPIIILTKSDLLKVDTPHRMKKSQNPFKFQTKNANESAPEHAI